MTWENLTEDIAEEFAIREGCFGVNDGLKGQLSVIYCAGDLKAQENREYRQNNREKIKLYKRAYRAKARARDMVARPHRYKKEAA